MKTLRLLASRAMMSVTTLVVVLSCAKEPVENLIPAHPSIETVTLHLSAPATKTSLQDDKTVLWSEGDKVVINHEIYEIKLDPVNPSVAMVENVVKADEYYAVYAVNFANGKDNFQYANSDGRYEISIYGGSYYQEGTFATYRSPMIAYGNNTNLQFYNLGSIIKVGLTGNGETISSVRLFSNGAKVMAGWISITEEQIRTKDFSDYPQFTDRAKWTELYVDCTAAPVTLSSTPTWFYFVAAPFTDEAGISLAVEDLNGNVFTRTKSDAFSVRRSEIKEMNVLEYSSFKKIELVENATTAVSLSVKAKSEASARVRYTAILAAAWDNHISGNPDYWTERGLAAAILNTYKCSYSDGGEFVMDFVEAYNYTGNAVPIAAETAYKIIAQYCIGNVGIGNCTVIDLTTSAPTGVAPSLDVDIESLSFDSAQVRIKSSDAASISVWMFAKSVYENIGKSDSEIMKEYGKPLNENELNDANAGGCLWSWIDLLQNTDYVVLVRAASKSGVETIVKRELKTEHYLFAPATTPLETVSTSGLVVSNLFRSFGGDFNQFRIEGLTIKKVPGEDIFVIENLFKGNAALQSAGFVDEEGTTLTIIDARDPSAVDIRYSVNKTGITNPMYSGYGKGMKFGCYATYSTSASLEQYPLGKYDKSEGRIELLSLVFGDDVSNQLYGLCSLLLVIEEKGAMITERFNKTTSDW